MIDWTELTTKKNEYFNVGERIVGWFTFQNKILLRMYLLIFNWMVLARILEKINGGKLMYLFERVIDKNVMIVKIDV